MTTGTMPAIEHWAEVGARLMTSPRVHRPSVFSALLASTMADTGGQVVVDAGCGVGLVTIAALAAGADQVVAQDYDPACLTDTAANVERVLGASARDRLTLWEADWRQLGPMRADLLAVNPPQRPTALLPDVAGDVRHLHVGGGSDGLAGMRLVLAHANARQVRTTAAAVLNMPDAVPGLCGTRWVDPVVVVSAEVPFDSAWRRLIAEPTGRAEVWQFTRRAAEPTGTHQRR